jgi:hypothetical protein
VEISQESIETWYNEHPEHRHEQKQKQKQKQGT